MTRDLTHPLTIHSSLDSDDDLSSLQFVKTPVNVTTNSPCQDFTHPHDHTSPTHDMTPGFKPFTALSIRVRCPFLLLFHLISFAEFILVDGKLSWTGNSSSDQGKRKKIVVIFASTCNMNLRQFSI